MTSLAAFPASRRVGRLLSLRLPLWAAILLALAAAQALLAPHSLELLETHGFFDTDDAMRAVQVRDLLDGQSWFDMTAYRLDPPQGVFSHWSRIIDAPLAGLELLLRFFLAPPAAELGARLLFPLFLLAALFSLSPWFARALDDKANPYIAVLLALLSGALVIQFLPGRIDHHAPQIVLLMATAGCCLRGLDAPRARWMAPASLAMALSLATSLENLPFFAVLLLALPLLFVIDGERMRAPFAWFSAVSAVAFPSAYAAAIAPSRYALSTCDAYSAPHLAAIAAGLAGLDVLAALSPRLRSVPTRALGVAFAGLAVGVTFLKIAPQCLGDPLGGVDPLVRDLWLSHVAEAMPLWKSWTKSPDAVIATAVPVLLALLAALSRVTREQGLARRRWAVALGLIAMGFILGFFWQVRIFTSVTPLAMATLVGVASGLGERLGSGFAALTRRLMVVAACIAMSPVGLAALLPWHPKAVAHEKNERACLTPQALVPLETLPPARIAASFDFGPYLLAYTPHSAFAGPYHRDTRGNRLVIDAFLADPESAEKMLSDAGATLVLWCAHEPSAFAARAPQGLAASLARSAPPAWLERLPQSTELLAIYALKK
ncbi:MAG: hypothetical protein WAK01_12240 [Methylocystis sp.]